ncbi:RNA-directed DNA polymerase from mobile element jockey [Eumeta japonica]|uniref:RNA-directed DNA polymerase from mobile element jockey n=1 Tax=Eumeta variegata TaxID=151549 RepID=A0A4C1W6R9_EUMVA|nr:RNA-directed DNA polymerase from mobile element jockey [Eumeta japonica]
MIHASQAGSEDAMSFGSVGSGGGTGDKRRGREKRYGLRVRRQRGGGNGRARNPRHGRSRRRGPPAPGRPVHHPSRTTQDCHTPPQKESPGTGRRVHGRAKASPQKGNSGHEQSVQRNTPHWSLPGGVEKGENHNDTQGGKRPAQARERSAYHTVITCGKDTPHCHLLSKVVANFLQRRSFCVAVDDVLSAPRPIEAGVPQGSCLSPELYAVYTDDIPMLHGHLEDWEDDVMLALYADYSAYFASSRRADLAAKRIQRVLDRLPEWLDKWRWPSMSVRRLLY